MVLLLFLVSTSHRKLVSEPYPKSSLDVMSVGFVSVCTSYFGEGVFVLLFCFKWLGCSLLLGQKGEAERRGVTTLEGGEPARGRGGE